MNVAFNLYLMMLIFPAMAILSLSAILFVVWMISGKPIVLKTIGYFWLALFGFILCSSALRWLGAKTVLDKADYYGEYVINRDYFKGVQTDWQYNHYRFEITEQDSLFFYHTDKNKILKTFRGTISTSKHYKSARLIFDMEDPTHHIMCLNPTTYRSAWNFYLVLYSPKFHNVFFKKGKWKRID